MSYVVKKIMTEDPFLDHVVYYAKFLALNCITKNDSRANSNETTESYTAYQRYFYARRGKPQWSLYDNFTFEEIKEATNGKYTDRRILKTFVPNKDNIPEEDRAEILYLVSNKTINNYEELNDYYREILGLRPSTSTVDIALSNYGFVNNLDLQHGIEYTYLHELPLDVLSRIDSLGILDKIIDDYPKENWIKYIKARLDSNGAIDIIVARQAEPFDLLYVPSGVDDIIRDEFIDRYDKNREYVLNSIYSEAFKYQSDYYDNFIQILILLLTMMDMIERVQDHIVRRDIMDVRCIQYIFEQYGIPYYEEIPLKYQMALCKNLNVLLKFKSSARCMIDLCSLFGFPSSEIFQLYLLKIRKLDENGNYIFNYKTIKTPITTEEVIKTSSTFDVGDDHIELDYPVIPYFENGNIIEVYLDDILISDDYYIITDNILKFINRDILEGHTKIIVKYIYTIPGEELVLPDYKILKDEEETEFHNAVSSYTLHPPIDNFFENGGFVKVIIGTLLYPESIYGIQDNILTFKESFLNTISDDIKYMKVLYFYSNSIKIYNETKYVTATENNQSSFLIPEPFKNYYNSGCRFFISIGGAYIVEDRYHIEDNTLIFNSNTDYVELGQNVIFHFIYSKFEPVDIIHYTRRVEATEPHQTHFDIPVPYESYFDDNNIVFIKVRGFYMPDKYYEINKNELVIDSNYSVYKGAYVEFEFVYGAVREVKHTTQIAKATIDYQQDFNIEWPYQQFLERGNKIRVYKDGEEYIQDTDFRIVKNTLEIFTVAKSLQPGEELHIEFFYTESNANTISIEETQCSIMLDNQTSFSIPVPFHKYFTTGNQILVTLGSTFVPSEHYVIDTNNKLRFISTEAVDLLKDRTISFTFIYHSIYESLTAGIYESRDSYDITSYSESHQDMIKLTIPFPFDNYLELGNTFIIRIDGVYELSEEWYDIIDNVYVLIHDANECIYPYGNHIQFVFTYACSGYEETVVEDKEKDCELKFVKVPIADNSDSYFKDPKNYIDYDSVTLNDSTWVGDYEHQKVKEALLDKEFNYTRTKYFSITNLVSMAKIAYQLPYFMNIFLDRVKFEESLTLPLPYLSTSHQFKFNDVLTYMMSLSHRYIGVKDEIPDMAKVLYIRGFNFEVDLAKIASYIAEKTGSRRYHSTYHISDKYRNFKVYDGQIPSYKELVNIYVNNTDIYDHVVYEMLNADNKTIFDVYKKIYESLMVIKESKEYFRIDENTIAPTITDWLNTRDKYLYESLLYVESISDDIERQKLISSYLEDCTYQIERLIDADLFRHVLGSFAGNDADALIKYLKLTINFFKSYKIQLHDVSIQYLFDDKLENTLRAIDSLIYNTLYTLEDEGHNIFELLVYLVTSTLRDKEITMSIREKLVATVKRFIQLNPKETIRPIDCLLDLITKLIIRDESFVKEIMYIISEMEIEEDIGSYIYDCVDLIRIYITKEEYINIVEQFKALVNKYKQSSVRDYGKIIEDIDSILVTLTRYDDIKNTIYDRFIIYSIFTLFENGDGHDCIKEIKSKQLIYDLVKFKEYINALEIYYNQSKYHEEFSINSYIDKFDTIMKSEDTILVSDHNTYTSCIASPDPFYIGENLKQYLTFSLTDILRMKEQIYRIEKKYQQRLGKEYWSVLSILDNLNVYLSGKDTYTIKDLVKKYNLYQKNDLVDILEDIRLYISYIRKDQYVPSESLSSISYSYDSISNADRFNLYDTNITLSYLTEEDNLNIVDKHRYQSYISRYDIYSVSDTLTNYLVSYKKIDSISLKSDVVLDTYRYFNYITQDYNGLDDNIGSIKGYLKPYDVYNVSDNESYLSYISKYDIYNIFDTQLETNIYYSKEEYYNIIDSLSPLYYYKQYTSYNDYIRLYDIINSIKEYLKPYDTYNIFDSESYLSYISRYDIYNQNDITIHNTVHYDTKDIFSSIDMINVSFTYHNQFFYNEQYKQHDTRTTISYIANKDYTSLIDLYNLLVSLYRYDIYTMSDIVKCNNMSLLKHENVYMNDYITRLSSIHNNQLGNIIFSLYIEDKIKSNSSSFQHISYITLMDYAKISVSSILRNDYCIDVLDQLSTEVHLLGKDYNHIKDIYAHSSNYYYKTLSFVDSAIIADNLIVETIE